jgi:hypothetical protein
MLDHEAAQAALDTLAAYIEAVANAADTMPTIDAGEVLAASAERMTPALQVFYEELARLQGQDPGDTSGTDRANADASAA